MQITAGDTLFAYAGEECRGLIPPKYEEDAGDWFFYLVVHGHGNSEQIRFKYFNEASSSRIDLHNSLTFEIDGIMGSPGQPYLFSDRALMVRDPDPDDGIKVNRVGGYLLIDLKESMHLQIFDTGGRLVHTRQLGQGKTMVQEAGWQSGIYLTGFRIQSVFIHKRLFSEAGTRPGMVSP